MWSLRKKMGIDLSRLPNIGEKMIIEGEKVVVKGIHIYINAHNKIQSYRVYIGGGKYKTIMYNN